MAAAVSPPTSLASLPDDILASHIIPHLAQLDLSSVALSSKRLHALSSPSLTRTFTCTTCASPLFAPRDLCDPRTAWRLLSSHPLHSDALPRRSFLELAHVPERVIRGATAGWPNFLAKRHLRQVGGEAYGVGVGVLGCGACGVYVGFLSDGRVFVGRDYVVLRNGRGVRVDEKGEEEGRMGSVGRRGGWWPRLSESHACSATDGKGVYCGGDECGSLLFCLEDFLPWSHVLASTRLADMDAFLEREHGWGGRQALFVRRFVGDFVVENVRWRDFRQGSMEVGDVKCHRCENVVGWRFLAERPGPEGFVKNFDQVGRYGVFRDAVRIRDESDDESD